MNRNISVPYMLCEMLCLSSVSVTGVFSVTIEKKVLIVLFGITVCTLNMGKRKKTVV